jgi:CheY-like chemotaxis protein
MKPSILIVDDEFGLADVIADILVEHGYDTEVAINGRLALEALLRRPAALVLLDVMMPVLDGPALLRTMRQDPGLAQVPVVFMTALPESLPDDRPPLYQAALIKPFTPAALLDTIARLLPPRLGLVRHGKGRHGPEPA